MTPGQGLAVDEDGADERLFRVYVVGRQAFGVQLSILPAGFGESLGPGTPISIFPRGRGKR